MNKNYILGLIVGVLLTAAFSYVLYRFDKTADDKANWMMPRIGQKVWTYNMNAHTWKSYNDNDDDNSKNTIILQYQEPEGSGGYTSYHLLTGNAQVPKEDAWIGEGSEEFIISKRLYSYYPKNFEFYEVVFNGVKFIPRKLSEDEISALFKGYTIIRVSELEKGTVEVMFSKSENKFMVLNDVGEDFYKYYIVPNDSKKLEIDRFSNQFKVSDSVVVKIQRLEGCSKAYPCYEINIR